MEKEKAKSLKKSLKERFTAKRLAFIAIFVALSYVVSFLEIPLPLFGASFLKLDFGNVFITLIAFLYGPVEGVIVCLLKECLRMIGGTFAGEVANFIVTCSFILLPSIVYKHRKSFRSVIMTLMVACLISAAVALFTNRFIVFPAYSLVLGGSIFGMTVSQAFQAFWVAVLIFNLIKSAAVAFFTVLLYKRISNFIKKYGV